VACALDALQALLAALADRDQLGLDLPAALNRQADRVCLRASGHLSVQLLRSGAREGGWLRRSMSQVVASNVSLIADQKSVRTDDKN
jgi:Flp pilus assembly protein TadB